ncbi:MAG: response regulator [Candidatus Saganbacteria bacterium]|nr:response regulator [Candidatus Saganbacteria bacterium]
MDEQREKIALYLKLKGLALFAIFAINAAEFMYGAIGAVAYFSGLLALAAAGCGGALLWSTLGRGWVAAPMVHASLVTDLLAILAGLYFNGGPQTTWGFLPVVVILIAGYLFDLRVALLYGVSSFVALCSFFVMEGLNFLPHQFSYPVPYEYWRSFNYQSDYLLGVGLLFAVSAVVSSYFGRTLRRSNEHLKEVLAVTESARVAAEASRKSMMNVMAELANARLELEQRVRERTRELEDIRDNLEKNVEERTRDLEAARRATLHMLKDLKEDMGKLEVVDRMKTEFLAMVSHELRTPLTPIKGYLSLMLSSKMGELSQQQRDALTVLARQSDHLQNLVESLLDISRLELGKPIPIVRVPLGVRQVMDEVLGAVRIMAESRGLNITLELAGNLPTIVADEIKLKRVIANLVGNSVKFTPKGGEVKVSAFPDGANVRIEVSDNGIGIPQDLLKKVFEKFFQIDSAYTRAAGGIGMGLAIARELVELHGGKIWAESAGPGKGAKFVVLLPIGGGNWLMAKKILIIEDYPATSKMIADLMRMEGFEPLVAGDGISGFNKAIVERPDLVLLDVMLPEMNGFEVCEKLKKNPVTAAIPVVIVSVRATDSNIREGTALGADAYIPKPFDPFKLVELVKQLVGEK